MPTNQEHYEALKLLWNDYGGAVKARKENPKVKMDFTECFPLFDYITGVNNLLHHVPGLPMDFTPEGISFLAYVQTRDQEFFDEFLFIFNAMVQTSVLNSFVTFMQR
jgi:hypothetical protein